MGKLLKVLFSTLLIGNNFYVFCTIHKKIQKQKEKQEVKYFDRRQSSY